MQWGILGGVALIVPLGSPNLDPISDEKMSFSTPVFGRCPLKSIHVFRPGGGHKTQHTYTNRNYVIFAETRMPTKSPVSFFLNPL